MKEVFQNSLRNSWKQQTALQNIVFAVQDFCATLICGTLVFAVVMTATCYPLLQFILNIRQMFVVFTVVGLISTVYIMYKKWYFHFYMWYIIDQAKIYWACIKEYILG